MPEVPLPLHQHLEKKRALDFFLFNKPIKADEAVELGLINEVADEPLARSKEIAR